MAKHEVVIHENTSATKTTAPYLGNYITKETIRESAFVSQLAKKSGLPSVQAQAILDGAFDALEALEKETLVRIHTDVGTMAGLIGGSFETADGAFNPLKNTFSLALYLDEDLRLSLVNVDVTISQDETLTKLRVDNVMDVAMQKPYNVIHGQNAFRVAGWNMVLSDEGASAFFENAIGQTFPAVIDEVSSKQLFKAHSATLLEAGDYKFVVQSRAGDAEGPLQTAFRRVKYLNLQPTGPTLTRIEDEEGHVGPTIGAGHDQDFLIGTNLAEATSVTMNGTSAGTPYMLNCEIKAKTATKLTINIPTDKFVSGDNQILLTVSTPAGIATLNANMEV